jgi:hypothetical protein
MCTASRGQRGPGPDRPIVAELHGAAKRHARWREPTRAETAAAVAELREIAGRHSDLLAETAGILLGAGRGTPDEARTRAAARLCVEAGADETLIPPWVEEGRRRAEQAEQPPFGAR